MKRKLVIFLLISLILNIAAVAKDQDESITVYITKTGEKYHVAGCRYLKKSSYAISLKEAKERGYSPCSVCDPPE